MTKQIKFDLLERATLFTLSLHMWRNRKKADILKIQTDADKSRISASKKLIEAKEYDDIRTYLNELKGWCMARCMPSYIKDGIYVVALTEVEKFNAKIAEAKTRLASDFVPKLVAVWPAKVAESEQKLKSLYDEDDYPTNGRLERSFGIDHSWITFSVPQNLPESVKREEAEKLRAKYEQAQQEMVAALRLGFQELMAHAIERLAVKPGEKPPVIRKSLLENFDEFFETFNARNLMEDEELEKAVEQAKGILAGQTAESLKDARQQLAGSFAKVKEHVDKLVQEAPTQRMFDFDEE